MSDDDCHDIKRFCFLVEMIGPSSSSNHTVELDNTTLSTTSSTTAASLLAEPEIKHFNWNEQEKQLILGSFFWGYILTELPGGRLAELVGGHRVFGHSMLWASVLTLLTPFAANLGLTSMVILRAVLGFMLGGKLSKKDSQKLSEINRLIILSSILARNSSDDSCVDSSNGSIEVHFEHDGVRSWSCNHDAGLRISHIMVRMAEHILPHG